MTTNKQQPTITTKAGSHQPAMSEAWRLGRSEVQRIEMANALRSLETLLGAIVGGKSTKPLKVQYAAQSLTTDMGKTVAIDGTLAAREAPISGLTFDRLCGQTIHEGVHVLVDSNHGLLAFLTTVPKQTEVSGLSRQRRITIENPQYKYAEPFWTVAEEIYVDSTFSRESVPGKYITNSRRMDVSENIVQSIDWTDVMTVWRAVGIFNLPPSLANLPMNKMKVLGMLLEFTTQVKQKASTGKLNSYPDRVAFYKAAFDKIAPELACLEQEMATGSKAPPGVEAQEDEVFGTEYEAEGGSKSLPPDEDTATEGNSTEPGGGQPTPDPDQTPDGQDDDDSEASADDGEGDNQGGDLEPDNGGLDQDQDDDGAESTGEPSNSGRSMSNQDTEDEDLEPPASGGPGPSLEDLIERFDSKPVIGDGLAQDIAQTLALETEDLSAQLSTLWKEFTGENRKLNITYELADGELQSEFNDRLVDELQWLRNLKTALGKIHYRGEARGLLHRRGLHRAGIDGKVFKRVARRPTQRRDITLLVDKSGSMSVSLPIYEATLAVAKVMPEVEVLAYSESKGVNITKHNTARGLIKILPGGSTPSGEAILVTAMKHPNGLIIHFTDGEPNIGTGIAKTMQLLKDKFPNVKVLTVILTGRYSMGAGDNYKNKLDNNDFVVINSVTEFPKVLRQAVEEHILEVALG